jgi:segregation and condensation protein A
MVNATDGYTVRLDVFQGPLDLLLHLIKRAELDISVISIAQITDQFMAHMERLEDVDVETAGEFLLIAATLLEIKSRTVMPAEGGAQREANADAEEDDVARELLGQLLEYKKYRDAADELEARKDRWERVFPAAHARVDKQALKDARDEEPELDLEDVELYDLVQAFQRIMESVVFDRLGDHEVTYDDTPIGLYQADIVDRLERLDPETGGQLRFRQLFEGRNKGEVIGLFLATLELVRERKITVEIDEDGMDVRISLRPESERDEHLDDDSSSQTRPEAWEDDHIFGDDEEPDDEDED